MKTSTITAEVTTIEYSNGDKIMALYPNAEIKFVNENGEEYVFVVMDGLGSTWNIKKSWWDAPYYGDKL